MPVVSCRQRSAPELGQTETILSAATSGGDLGQPNPCASGRVSVMVTAVWPYSEKISSPCRLCTAPVAPCPHPAHRTGHAELPHPALGQDFTPSPTAGRARAGSGVRARSARKGARVDKPRLASPDLVLEAQPHSRVAVDRPERLPGGQCTHWKSGAFSRCTPEAGVSS
jgi:hypothetical protein